MSAVDEVRKLRAQDLAAARAANTCQASTHYAATVIKGLPQLAEADALFLLHALQLKIERDGSVHEPAWRAVCDGLGVLQAVLADQRSDAAQAAFELAAGAAC